MRPFFLRDGSKTVRFVKKRFRLTAVLRERRSRQTRRKLTAIPHSCFRYRQRRMKTNAPQSTPRALTRLPDFFASLAFTKQRTFPRPSPKDTPSLGGSPNSRFLCEPPPKKTFSVCVFHNLMN